MASNAEQFTPQTMDNEDDILELQPTVAEHIRPKLEHPKLDLCILDISSGISVFLDALQHFIHKSKRTMTDKHITITIYHIIIGAYTYKDALKDRNHEFPEYVKNMLLSPMTHFTPDMVEWIKKYNKVTITQVLVLIDPQYDPKYNKDNNFIGISHALKELHLSPEQLSIEHTMEHDNANVSYKTNITSEVKIIIIPNNINEQNEDQIKDIICNLQEFSRDIPVLINCMSCTGGAVWTLYSENTANNVRFIRPDCMINDKEPYLKLVLTIDKDGCRWLSYKLDIPLLRGLKSVMDKCQYSKATYDAILILYEHNIRKIEFVLLFKMLSFMSITKTLPNGTKKHFSDMTLQEFLNIWHEPEKHKELSDSYTYNTERDPEFIDYFKTYFGFTYKYDAVRFINIFIDNEYILNAIAYDNKTILNSTMIDIINTYTANIIDEYNKYFPDKPIILVINEYYKKQIKLTLRANLQDLN